MAALQTPWYNKTVKALQLNGKGERTQQTYARAVRMLIEFYRKDPDADDAEAPSSAPTTPACPVCGGTIRASRPVKGLQSRHSAVYDVADRIWIILEMGHNNL